MLVCSSKSDTYTAHFKNKVTKRGTKLNKEDNIVKKSNEKFYVLSKLTLNV